MALHWLILIACLGSTLSMEYAEKCCKKGMRFGNIGIHTKDQISCDIGHSEFQMIEKELLLKNNLERIMCKGFYKQCCITAAKSQYCVLGMMFGRKNGLCLRGSNALAGDAQRTCCDCCKSGRKAGAQRLDCDKHTFKDVLCTHSYTECCNEIKKSLPVEPTKTTMKGCKDIHCDFHSTESCTETSKGPQCICKIGFIALNDGITCVDIDECANGEAKCGGTSKCVNTKGSYTCSCDQGFTYENETCVEQKAGQCEKGYENKDGKCVDIDECATQANICPAHMFCLNTEGLYNCVSSCNYPKYEYVHSRKNNICKDVNECLNPKACHQDTHECINQIGGHVCKLVRCPNGYKLSDGFCIDVNECEDRDICGKYGVCRNGLGNYYCDCHQGYKYNMNTRKCEDIDECKLNRHRCSFRCVNTQGSYHCQCPSGYQARGQHQAFCVDIDECKTQNPCSGNEYCFNTYGSYRCINETCPQPHYIRAAHNGKQIKSCWKNCHQVKDQKLREKCYDKDSFKSIKRVAFKYEKEIVKSEGTNGFEFHYWWQFPSTMYHVTTKLVKGNEEGLFELLLSNNKKELTIVNKETIEGQRDFHIVMETYVTQIGNSEPSWKYQYHIYIFISHYRLT